MKSYLLLLSAACLWPMSLPADIRINEVHFNPTGPDLNYEFIELKSTTNDIESLAGLSLILVNSAISDEGDYKNPGEILEVFELGESSTGSNGLLLLGHGYTESPRGGPWSGVIDPSTAVADPTGLGNSDLKTNTGISILLVRNYNAAAGPPGTDIATGTNGLVLLGDGYDNTNGPYAFSEGPLPANSAAFDPPVGLEGNDFPNDGCAILLVRGIKGPITLEPSGRPIGDLDPENDGTLLPPAAFTDELVDSIAVSSRSPGPGYAWINSSSFNPHHIARYPSQYSASTANAWYGGHIGQTAPFNPPFPSTSYTGTYRGRFQGAASPGRLNHGATPGPVGPGAVVFNEIHLNPAGADHNFEFIELLSVNREARSLNGYSILAIDNFGSNTGAVRNAWSLDGMATGSNGLILIGNQYLVPSKNPWTQVLRPQPAWVLRPARKVWTPASPRVCSGCKPSTTT